MEIINKPSITQLLKPLNSFGNGREAILLNSSGEESSVFRFGSHAVSSVLSDAMNVEHSSKIYLY